MKIIDADKLIYEDVKCIDGNTYMVVHAPQIDNAAEINVNDIKSELAKEILEWINTNNRGCADYFIVDKIEEICMKYLEEKEEDLTIN